MSDTPSVPVEVCPLAMFLCEEMEARGWKTDDVAIRMGGATVSDIARDLLAFNLIISVQSDALILRDEDFDALSLAFGVSAEMFRNLDKAWRNHPDRRAAFTPPESIYGPASRRSMLRVVSRPVPPCSRR